ncbi:MAG: hypothetical protein P8X90_33780, partial [Desulfobacterales bacterium]
ILGKSSVDVLNRPVADLFTGEGRAELIDGLKQVRRQADINKVTFYATFHTRLIETTISTVKMHETVVGWVVALTPSLLNNPNRPTI